MDQGETQKRCEMSAGAVRKIFPAASQKPNRKILTCALATILSAGMIIWLLLLAWAAVSLTAWLWSGFRGIVAVIL